MNQRLQELAERAGFNLIRQECYDITSTASVDEFARLIVKDLIEALEFHGFEDAIPYIKWYAKNKLGV